MGKLKDYHLQLHIDSSVVPVAQPIRRLPFSVRKLVEEKLQQLEQLDVIEKAEGPTPWVSPIVVVHKNGGDIRICVDMRRVNEAVVHERYPIPTIDEILEDMTGAEWFSKLDLKWGYHQIELEPESQALTAFLQLVGPQLP